MSKPKWVDGIAKIAEAIGCTATQVRAIRSAGALSTERIPGGGGMVRAKVSSIRKARAYFKLYCAEHASGPEHGQVVGCQAVADYLGTTRYVAEGLVSRNVLPSCMTTTSPRMPRVRVRDLDAIRAAGLVPESGQWRAPPAIPRPGPLPDVADVHGETRRLLLLMRVPLWRRLAQRGLGEVTPSEASEALEYEIEVSQ